MQKELRCQANMHAILLSPTELEVKCKRRRCGAKKGTIVLHIFDLNTGKLIATRCYRDPATKEE